MNLREFMKQIKFVIVVAFLLTSLVIVVPKGSTQTQVETAGQKFKNIKVLNDLPADQLGPMMNVMAASLGMDCKGCHAANDKDFEKDGNEHKEAARKMIKMVQDINKSAFEGKNEVTCNTCHNGRERPVAVAAVYPAAPPERPKQPDVKPTIDQILEKYAASLGAKDVVAKVGSRYIKASRVEKDGKTTEVEEIWTKGSKSLMTTKYPDAAITEAFDGTTAWKRSGAEAIALRPFEIEQIKRDAMIFGNPDLKSVYTKLDYRIADKIDGHDVYLVQATTAGNQRERLYFDALTGSLVRRIAAMPTIVGVFQYQVDYADFKDFGGVKLPATIKFAVPAVSWTRKIIEVKNNEKVDDAKFAQPKG
jgi:hypothetical protein